MQPNLEYQAQNTNEKSDIKFAIVEGNEELIKTVQKLFEEIIVPLYGDQSKAINRIRGGQDRTTKLLLENNHPASVLVVKTISNNEFSSVGAHNSIEIKTLFVVNPVERQGRGIGKKLLIEAIAQGVKSGADYLAVTVSENKTESLGFFQSKGFEIKKAMPDKYIKGVVEYLLIKKLN